MNSPLVLLSQAQIDLKLKRIAYEIAENYTENKKIIFAGIAKNGILMVDCLEKYLHEISDIEIQKIEIHIDKKNPIQVHCVPDITLDNASIIIVDDVANTGKTLMYALSPFLHKIHKSVQVAVLLDRKHKAFPVTPDYIGLQLSTTIHEHIIVSSNGNYLISAHME